MGTELGAFVQSLHEAHGVVFHLGQTGGDRVDGRTRHAERRRDRRRRLRRDGRRRPAVDRAGRAGRSSRRPRHRRSNELPRDQRARRSSPRATSRAGRIRTPSEQHSRRALGRGASARARSRREHARPTASAFDAVPFFWSQHYDVSDQLRRARRDDGTRCEIDGTLNRRDCAVTYTQTAIERLHVATIFRIGRVCRPKSTSSGDLLDSQEAECQLSTI